MASRVRRADAGFRPVGRLELAPGFSSVLARSLDEARIPAAHEPAQFVVLTAIGALARRGPDAQEALLTLERIKRKVGDHRSMSYLRDPIQNAIGQTQRLLDSQQPGAKE